MKAGRSLERLVAQLESVIGNKENVSVESPKRLRDSTNGRLREHDVLVTVRHGHYEIVIAIECRDRSRKIGVGQVEGFWKKCQDTGVNQPVMVSPLGFWESAIKKAQALGVRCLFLEDAVSFDWLLASGLTQVHRIPSNAHWTIIPQNKLKEVPRDYKLVAKDGREITVDVLNANLDRKISELPLDTTPDIQKLQISFLPGELQLKLGEKGPVVPINVLVASIEIETRVDFAPFVLKTYSDAVSGECITDAATVQVDAGNVSGQIVISYRKDQGGAVSFIPEEQ